ncbi:pyruvate-flavodoxin oxidoreductase [Salmonella enterica subsp. enterica]|uniref:Pyruvate-flavodoxin oxidoreductase n=1 Tax=Salmonella enterica I TaxID=59201 RepID=A0A379WV87_SALET|nr:pyruvate-flavodoxin oxidoreductase [Salmonella enterica subsp. enterica]
MLNQKKARFYVVNAAKIARECGLGARINTVMQMAFFHLTHILPGDSALVELQGAIAKSYSSKGQDLVERNWQALALAQNRWRKCRCRRLIRTARIARRSSPTPRRIS